ncbi:MAG: DUF58 domain-containing protein [Gammaproteobacteria bacterium]
MPPSRSPEAAAAGFPARLAARIRHWPREWARRRQGPDPEPVALHRRRVYILPTALGAGFGLSLFGMLLAAMNYNNSMAFALTFLLAGLGLVAMHWSHQNLTDSVVRGLHLGPAFAGGTARLEMVLENPGRGRRYDLEAAVDGTRSAPADIPGGRSARLALELPAPRRGRLRLERVKVTTDFPFGLFRAWAWLHPDCTGVVYPAPATHPPSPPGGGPEEAAGRWDENRGEDDFAGLRSFRPGDSPRRVAWKAAARGDELLVKQFAGSPRGAAWLDWESLPGVAPEGRLSILCRWVLDAHAGGERFGLRLPGTEIPPGLGTAHRHRCLAALALFPGGDGPADG